MPRAAAHPEERLLDEEECMARLHCGRDVFREKVRPHEIVEKGRKANPAGKVCWLASAIAAYIKQLPKDPERRPPNAGNAASLRSRSGQPAGTAS